MNIAGVIASLWLLLGAVAVPAQQPAPVEDMRARENAVQRAQQQAGAAFRKLEQSQFETKLAEQEFVNTEHEAKAWRARLDAARQARDAARAREEQSRKAYEAALQEVDRVFGRKPGPAR